MGDFFFLIKKKFLIKIFNIFLIFFFNKKKTEIEMEL